MNKKELRAFMDLLMVSDPFPLSKNHEDILIDLADGEANNHGFPSWIDAYHKLEDLEILEQKEKE